MKKKIVESSIVILAFLISLYGNRVFQYFFEISIDSKALNLLISYSWRIIPVLVALSVLYGFKNVLKELGLDKDIILGFKFAVLSVSTMLFSSAFAGEIGDDLQIVSLLNKTLFAGLTEEILFRGFLFGILFRKVGWGFIPASLMGALIFGISHLYQGSTIPEMMGIFFVTFIGAAWFAWLYIEWDENLWIPIFLHILMNLSWALFNMSDNALGDVYANAFRAITIAITVVVTIWHSKKRNWFAVNGTNLLRNQAAISSN